MESVINSTNTFLNQVFPSLFPFFIISHIMCEYGFVELFSELFKPLMHFFKINPNVSFAFAMGTISGFPSSSKYLNDLYKSGKITAQEAAKALIFTHFSNPLFLLGTLSISFLKNKKAGFLILILHYSTNILLGFLFRNYLPSQDHSKMRLLSGIENMHQKRISNHKSFVTILGEAITSAFTTLLIILGTMTTFFIITAILLQFFSLPPYIEAILRGILEMTQGLKYVSLLSLPIRYLGTLAIMMISFGGISVYMQVKNVLDKEINTQLFVIARLLHSAISGILFFLIFPLI